VQSCRAGMPPSDQLPVSTWIVQQGHLSHCPSQCLRLRFLFVAAIFITCLHAQTCNSRDTSSCSVRCSWGQSTLSNTSVNILLVWWKMDCATWRPAAYRMCAPVSEVIFFPLTNMQIGSSGNASCGGRFVTSWECSIAFAPASHAKLSCAAQVRSSHQVWSSWCAATW
jgi:hypothetical protein